MNSFDGGCSSSEASSDIVLASATPKKCAGRRKFKETRHPVYRGVRSRDNNKWVCEVRVPNDKNTRIWLGSYPTPEMAARAHDVAALALRGKSACLNFADSAWLLPPLLPASNSAEEIRKVAMEAAEAFAIGDRCQPQQQQTNNGEGQGMCLDENQEVPDWLQSMVDEPLRSPPHPFLQGSSYGGYSYGTTEYSTNDHVEEGDAEVSLWSFSK